MATSKALEDQNQEDDLAMEPRRHREFSDGESFKATRVNGTPICPVKEAHGLMRFHMTDLVWVCTVSEHGYTRTCSTWSDKELNPKVAHFVVEVVAATPTQPPAAPKPKAQPTEQGSGPECQCGCGEHTKGGRYRPGHDARHHAALKRQNQP